MATIKKFEDIEAWQKARELAHQIYLVTKETELNKDYRFKDQINAAAGSIMDNIAEGFERGGRNEFINFLTIAKASCGEVRSQLYRVMDREYITQDKCSALQNLSIEIANMLGGWISYLNQSTHKGTKFKNRTSDNIK